MIELLRTVYVCDHCLNLGFGFTRPRSQAGFYKFPPTIGAVGEASLLFIGINPRNLGNEALHERIMTHPEAFEALSQNRVDQERYIKNEGEESHYRPHMRIVRGVYGAVAQFEDHAVVTELYFCATPDSKSLGRMKSPCANTYLNAVLDQVKPRLIICIGKLVWDYVRWKFAVEGDAPFEVSWSGRKVRVVRTTHPNDPNEAGREQLLRNAIAEAQALTR